MGGQLERRRQTASAFPADNSQEPADAVRRHVIKEKPCNLYRCKLPLPIRLDTSSLCLNEFKYHYN